MRKFFRAIKLGCLGLTILLTLASLLVTGAAAGAYWYLTRSDRLNVTLTYMVDGNPVEIKVRNETALPEEDVRKMLEQGQVQGSLEVMGPWDLKLMGLRLAVFLPIDQIIDQVLSSVAGGLFGKGGLEGKMAEAVLGDRADMTVGQVMATVPQEELRRLLGPQYEQVLENISAGVQDKTLREVFAQDFDRVAQVLVEQVPPQTLEQAARDLLKDDADKTMSQLLVTAPSQELQDILGPETYRQVVKDFFAGETEKTLAQVFAQDPGRLLKLAKDTLASQLIGGLFKGE